MGRVSSIYGRNTFKMKGKYAYILRDLGVDGRIILNSTTNSSDSR
jgi:hypothetical protein